MPTNFISNKNVKRRFLYYDKKFNEYLNCDIYGKNCEKILLSKKQKIQALAQELKDKNNNLIFVGKKRKIYLTVVGLVIIFLKKNLLIKKL